MSGRRARSARRRPRPPCVRGQPRRPEASPGRGSPAGAAAGPVAGRWSVHGRAGEGPGRWPARPSRTLLAMVTAGASRSANQREMCRRACGVLTNSSHSGDGPRAGASSSKSNSSRWPVRVTISTVSPSASGADTEMRRPFMRAPIHRLPMSAPEHVCEVNRSRLGRQQHRPPGRVEHHDLALGQVAAQRRDELRRVGRRRLPVEQPAQPVQLLGLARRRRSGRRVRDSGSSPRCRTRRPGASPRSGSAPRASAPSGPRTVVCSER